MAGVVIKVTFTIPFWLLTILVRPILIYRRLRHGYPFCRIPLTKGRYAIVDPDDYRDLAKHKWHVSGRHGNFYYAVRTSFTKNGERQLVSMHRQIINAPDNLFVDHINRNSLDNRKANLRSATRAQNGRNRVKFKSRKYSSKYKGVTWRRGKKPWDAHIMVNKKSIYLGSFYREAAAAEAYDRAAKKYHGDFAALNFPGKLERARRRMAVVKMLMRIISRIYPGLMKLPPAVLTGRPAIHKVATMAKKLYVIDGHAHIYAAYHASVGGNKTDSKGKDPWTSPITKEPTQAVYIFTMALMGLIKRKNPDLLVVALDSKTKTFRHGIYPEYKANRPEEMPEGLPEQIERIEQILAAMNIPILRVDGFEADDIIGTLAKKAAADGYESLICSKDKDLLQLIDEHISTYDIKTDTVTDVAALAEKMGITPEQFIDCLALQGDTSDNVPGVPLIGEVIARQLIQKYGTIENLYEHIDEIKGKRGDNLRKFKDQAMLSRELVTLDCNVPLEIDYKDMKLSKYNDKELTEIFNELGFTRLLNQLSLADRWHGLPARENMARDGHATHYQLIDTQEKFEKFFAKLKKQKLFAVDTETTSIYPMRAELVGMSFSWQQHTGYYLPFKAPLGAKHLDINKIRPKLAPILADRDIRKIGQNIKYDMLVLQNAKMPVGGIYFDTMVASYCLDPGRSHSMDNMAMDFLDYECIPISALIGKGKNQLTFDMVDTEAACEYAAEDADITYRLYLYLKEQLDAEPQLLQLFEQLEMPLVPVLAAMEYNGVSLDTGLLRKMSGEITETLKTVTEKIYEQTGEFFNIDSPKQLAEILFDKLNLPPVRVTKSGRSTDAAVLEQLTDQHPVIELILQYRMLSKLKNTYVDKLGSLIHPRTGRVHASFNQTITATGRLSSSNPNLQNIPIRTELGSKVRSAFIPKNKSDCILSADYSQIELRLLAHFSKDPALMAAFEADRDIHSFVASQIFDCPIEKVTGEMRSRCKAVNFGIIYGQGPFGLSRTIGITQAEAKKFIEDYFCRYGSIRKFMDECIARAKREGYAETILRRRRAIPNLNSKNANRRSQAERLAVNTVVQGSAADLIKVAMINIQEKIEAENLPVKMILQVHDELVFELPVAEAQEHARWIEEQMSGAIKLDVPMKVDITIGPTWQK